MQKSKLAELIQSLNQYEVKAFKSYLDSPYFNENKKVNKCFDAVLAFNKQKQEFSRKELHKKINGIARFNDQQIRYLLTDLTKHLEYYITLKGFDKEVLLQNTICAKELAKRDCEKSYQYRHHLIKQNDEVKNSMFYYHQFVAADHHLNYTGSKQSRKKKLDYQDTLLHLETFYLSRKLQLFCEVINLKNILSGDFDLHLFKEIKEIATKEPFSKIPVVQIYYHILLTLTDADNEKNFNRLRELLIKHGPLFPVLELKDMYQYVKNYCVKKINQGSTSFVKTLFEIYKTMLADKRLMNAGYLSQWEYKNMVSIGLRLNEKNWCRTFINMYINYLLPAERKNSLAYNLAYWYFMNGDFKKALKQLQDVVFTDVFYQLDARVILLKAYYELDEVETFFYHASAFRLFLLRNRTISEYQRTINRNLIKFLTRLVRSGVSNSKLLKLKQEIAAEKNVADLNWLNEKVEALI